MAYKLDTYWSSAMRAPRWRVPAEYGQNSVYIAHGKAHDPAKEPLPTCLIREDDKQLLDVMMESDKAPIVSERLRALIEEMEPGVHGFFPVELLERDGRPMPERYFWLHIGQAVDAALRAESRDPIRWFGLEDSGSDRPPLGNLPPLGVVFSRPRIAGRHLWTGNLVSDGKAFLSNALFARIDAEMRHDLEPDFLPEADMPWSLEKDMPEVAEWHTRNPDCPREQLEGAC